MNSKTIINNHQIAGRMPLFKPEQRQANRDGRKTQTRRVIKFIEFGPSDTKGYDWHFRDKRLLWNDVSTERLLEKFCPYRVGDIRVMCEPIHKGNGTVAVDYAFYSDTRDLVRPNTSWPVLKWRWKRDYLTSVHMPHEAARSLFEITDIRVERVQDVSDKDCEAEGVRPSVDGDGKDWREKETGWRRTFRQLWDSINAARGYSWESNPWVWVYSYKAVK